MEGQSAHFIENQISQSKKPPIVKDYQCFANYKAQFIYEDYHYLIQARCPRHKVHQIILTVDQQLQQIINISLSYLNEDNGQIVHGNIVDPKPRQLQENFLIHTFNLNADEYLIEIQYQGDFVFKQIIFKTSQNKILQSFDNLPIEKQVVTKKISAPLGYHFSNFSFGRTNHLNGSAQDRLCFLGTDLYQIPSHFLSKMVSLDNHQQYQQNQTAQYGQQQPASQQKHQIEQQHLEQQEKQVIQQESYQQEQQPNNLQYNNQISQQQQQFEGINRIEQQQYQQLSQQSQQQVIKYQKQQHQQNQCIVVSMPWQQFGLVFKLVSEFLLLQDFLKLFRTHKRFNYLKKDMFFLNQLAFRCIFDGSLSKQEYLNNLIQTLQNEISQNQFKEVLKLNSLSTNRIEDPNAQLNFKGWKIVENGGSQIKCIDQGFITSFSLGKMLFERYFQQLFTEQELKDVYEGYLSKGDQFGLLCGAKFSNEGPGSKGGLQLVIIDSIGKVIFKQKLETETLSDMHRYLKINYLFKEGEKPSKVQLFVEGQDTCFWNGHYGAIISDIYLKFIVIDSEQQQNLFLNLAQIDKEKDSIFCVTQTSKIRIAKTIQEQGQDQYNNIDDPVEDQIQQENDQD